MKTKKKLLFIMVIALSLFIISGCISKPKMTNTGFLTDYSLLHDNDPLGYSNKVYVNEKFDPYAYDKFMMDEVIFFIKEDAEYKGIPANDLADISNYLYEAVVREVSKVYTFTDKPGPGVIRYRFAITDIVPTEPITSTVTTVVPVGLVASMGARGLAGAHIGMGGVSFEAEGRDSVTNVVLGSAIDAKTGKKYKVTKNFTKWAQVKSICDDWANNLRKRLEIMKSRKQ